MWKEILLVKIPGFTDKILNHVLSSASPRVRADSGAAAPVGLPTGRALVLAHVRPVMDRDLQGRIQSDLGVMTPDPYEPCYQKSAAGKVGNYH